jgi:hypothetical protein
MRSVDEVVGGASFKSHQAFELYSNDFGGWIYVDIDSGVLFKGEHGYLSFIELWNRVHNKNGSSAELVGKKGVKCNGTPAE